MIYTVTLNPSLDYMAEVPNFTLGIVNRTTKEQIFPGGKGINVSIMLKHLGYESIALGFCAGFTGEKLRQLLKDAGVKEDFIAVKEGMTRINVKLHANQETEINGQGPEISKEEMGRLYQKLEQLKEEDVLVLAGSIPDIMPKTTYKDMMDYVKEKNPKVVVDATGELLVNVLKHRPFLIKPNCQELEEIFRVTITKKEQAMEYGRKLQEMGAKNVLISMAGQGAVLVAEDGRGYSLEAPKGKVMNSVGAGDSMVAGFLAGYEKTESYTEAFRVGICAGSASAFSRELAKKQEVQKLLCDLPAPTQIG